MVSFCLISYFIFYKKYVFDIDENNDRKTTNNNNSQKKNNNQNSDKDNMGE